MTADINLQAAIFDALVASDAPMCASEINRAIAIAGTSTDAVRSRLGNLVRDERAVRLHCPDGILRYSANAAKKRARGAQLSDDAYAKIEEALEQTPGLGNAALAAATHLAPARISAVLYELKKSGRVERSDSGTSKQSARWCLRDSSDTPPPTSAQPTPVSPPAPMRAHSAAHEGPAPVALESPAPPRTPDAATPRVAHVAALETSFGVSLTPNTLRALAGILQAVAVLLEMETPA